MVPTHHNARKKKRNFKSNSWSTFYLTKRSVIQHLMVSNSKKYFTALFVRTALKTNTKRFYPTEIPIFRKSISGTCIPHVQIKESKKLNTKLIMEAQLPSYSWQCLTLCVCALSMLCTERDPMAFQKMGLFGAFSTEQLCCICRANGWLSQVTESEQHCQGWLCVEG